MALPGEPNKKYIPPKEGILHLKVADGFVQKEVYYTISNVDQKYAYAMACGMGDVSMVATAVQHTKSRFDEAYRIYKSAYSELRDKASTLMKVLPLMTNAADARQLVSKVTEGSRAELARIKLSFGIAYRPLQGAYDGYYCLDLSKELHRMCLSRLLLESQTICFHRASKSIIHPGKVGDLSQNGNWTCFRNEVYNGAQMPINPKLFTPIPQTGTLEFDFSGSPRPKGGALRVNDRRFCKALQNICLLKPEESEEAIAKLADWKHRAHEMNRDHTLFMPIYAFTVAKALEVGRYMDEFYDHLLERSKLIHLGMKNEDISLRILKSETQSRQARLDKRIPDASLQVKVLGAQARDNPAVLSRASSAAQLEPRDNARFHSSLETKQSAAHSGSVETVSESEEEEEEEEEEIRGKYISSQQKLERRQQRIENQRRRLQKLLSAPIGVSKHVKARRLLEHIDETFNRLWISARHLALIITFFRKIVGCPSRCKYFGSYCTDIVVCLFSRVVDLHNFELVWEVLDAIDCAAVMCRIGVLNVFNPMKPEMSLELRIDRREERLVAKMIVVLSKMEPGVNITFQQFRWKRELDPIPGWEGKDLWMTAAGMSVHGYFAFTYYSGEGRNKNGCCPDLFLRKALTAFVLIDENEIVAEDKSMPETLVNTAARHYEHYRDVWVNFLTAS
jgi:hypothetical protein